MPYVILIVAVFAIGLVLSGRASKQTYLLVALAAAAATVYVLR